MPRRAIQPPLHPDLIIIPKPAPLEKAIRLTIRDGLRALGFMVWRNDATSWGKYQVDNAGSPDLIGILPGGRFLGIECKKPKANKQRHEAGQAEWGARASGLGALVFRARSLDEVLARFRTEGLIA